MDIIITLLAVVGLFVVLRYSYRCYMLWSSYNYMLNLTERYFQSITPEAALARLRSGKASDSETIPYEIYEYCMKNSTSRYICEHYRATAKDFYEIFETLSLGCPYTYKNLFLPISVFFFCSSLDYVLKNKENLHSEQAHSDLIRFIQTH